MKKLFVLLSLAVASMTFVGCSSNDADGNGVDTTAPSGVTTTTVIEESTTMAPAITDNVTTSVTTMENGTSADGDLGDVTTTSAS